MKRILSLFLCLGLASTVAVQAKDNDKRSRKHGKAEAKIAKQGAKFERKVERGPSVARSNATQKIERGNSRAVTRRGPANFSWSYSEARRNHHRGVLRDRAWYRGRYNRFALFAGGYYYFDRGYWYPAYGYDSAYSTYRFDEPIYGYNSLDPSQVIVNVQSELRRQGYYRGSIDGLIGPMTRSALARYQRDRGLYVTRAIDGPTLAALGLT